MSEERKLLILNHHYTLANKSCDNVWKKNIHIEGIQAFSIQFVDCSDSIGKYENVIQFEFQTHFATEEGTKIRLRKNPEFIEEHEHINKIEREFLDIFIKLNGVLERKNI